MNDVETPLGSGGLKWVSTHWLEQHLGDNLTILDVQPDVHDYILTHIPGAVYLAEKTLRAPLNGTPERILPEDIVGSLFGRVGIDKRKPVVVYTAKGGYRGWGDGLEQTMMAYTLRRMGHLNVYLLDGGLDKWTKEAKKTSQIFPRVKATGFQSTVDASMFVDLDEFVRLKNRSGSIVLDARPSNLYSGEAGPWIRNGHIPNAFNLSWPSLMDSDNRTLLKPLEEIEKIVASAGASRDKQVFVYCGTGREATDEFLILKHLLGFSRIRLYEGSFTEWSSHPELEVVKGLSSN